MQNLKSFNGILSNNDSADALSSSIYEVIRIRGGEPQFLAEHLDRLMQSAQLTGIPLERSAVERQVDVLLKAAELVDQNIRIDVMADGSGTLIRPVASFYPAPEVYRSGVEVLTYHYVRNNPHAKVSNPGLAAEAKRIREEKGVFEILLLDDAGDVTEGSRSNVFFISGDRVITSLPEQSLQGVTKQMVVKIAGDRLVERRIAASELASFDAAFLTGTSIDLLPIRAIDELRFDSANNTLYRRLLEQFLRSR